MTRLQLERRQVWFYLAALACGLGLGNLGLGNQGPDTGSTLELLLWPLLGALIFVTFTQVPLATLPQALRDRRFMGAILAGNFLIVPLIVAALLPFLPADPAIRLGVALVLLVPCTDWYITFTHMAGGDTGRAIAATPVNLIAQMVLLPVWLWVLLGGAFLQVFDATAVMGVFTTLILVPLAAALALQHWAGAKPAWQSRVAALGWLPVPLLALVILLVSATHSSAIHGVALQTLLPAVAVFTAFLVLALLAGLMLARGLRLPAGAARALVFSMGTRNSFMVLPFALALTTELRLAVLVIVLQSLVELFGMLAYLKLLPRLLPLR